MLISMMYNPILGLNGTCSWIQEFWLKFFRAHFYLFNCLFSQPDRPDEKERVEAAGGRIINWNGCRVLGVLATSRSIGMSKNLFSLYSNMIV